MKKQLRIKHYGVNEKGIIIFFLGRQKSHRYYRSIVQELAEGGYLVIAIPYGISKVLERIETAVSILNLENSHVILMSHAQGDEKNLLV